MDFDFQSNVNRIITNLQTKNSWKNVLDFSSVNGLIEAFAKEEAEIINFSNYETKENQWNLSKNRSSLLTQNQSLKYKVHRKKGATTSLTFSASPTFNQVPAKTILIPKYTVVSDVDNPDIKVSTIQNESINTSDVSKDIPVVQGVPKSFTILAVGQNYEEVVVNNSSIDNTTYEVKVNDILYTQVDFLIEQAFDALVYEIENKPDFSGVIIRFGNGIFGKKLVASDSVVFNYIETLGSAGDIFKKNVLTTVESTIYDIDNAPVTIYTTNASTLSGGTDYEAIESIRINAPNVHQAGDSATKTSDYLAILFQNSTIAKANVWGEYEYLVDRNLVPGNFGSFVPLQENLVHIIAFKTTGDNLSQGDKDSLIAYLNTQKSPTDVIEFDDTEFIYLVFISNIFVKDRSFSLATIKNTATNILQDTYSIENFDFNKSVYETDYKSLIDSIEGVDHNTTTVRVYNYFIFDQAISATFSLSLFPVVQSTLQKMSIKLFIQDIANPLSSEIYVGYDDPSGNGFIAEPDYDLSGSSVEYDSGIGFIQLVQISAPTQSFLNYQLRVEYEIADSDLILKNRNQFFRYGSSNVNCSYMK